MNAAAEAILDHVTIGAVWRALGGGELRHHRGQAFWRAGQGWNVALSDAKGTWFDHRDNVGGGILDLVVHVRGGSREDALRWCADLAGVAFEDKPLSAEDRARWVAERRAIERDLPAAWCWRSAAVNLGEEALEQLKAALFDPATPPLEVDEIGEIGALTRQVARWRRLAGAELVSEFNSWKQHHPELTSAMEHVARGREMVSVRALLRYREATA
jgi:hypothetical protein